MKTYAWDPKLRAYLPAKDRKFTVVVWLVALFVTVPMLMGAVTTIDLLTQTRGTLSEVRGGTNQTSYSLGDILYASAANTLSKLAGNTTTTKKLLCQTGDGANSAAPDWCTLVAGDIPNLDAGKITSGTMATARLGSGTANSGTYLRGDQTWAAVAGALTVISNETPSGTINGTNAVFTTAQSCTNLYLFKNGQRMTPGALADYTYSTNTITFTTGAKPQTGDVLLDDCEY